MFEITCKNAENLFIVYELDIWLCDLRQITFKDCLFRATKLTMNADPDKYSAFGYGIEFNSHLLFLIQNFDFGKNVIFWCRQQFFNTY